METIVINGKPYYIDEQGNLRKIYTQSEQQNSKITLNNPDLKPGYNSTNKKLVS